MKKRFRKVRWITLVILVAAVAGLIYFKSWDSRHREFLEVGSDIDGYLGTYSTDFQTMSRSLLLNSYKEDATVNFLAYPGTPENKDGVIDLSYKPLAGETPRPISQQINSYFDSIAKIDKAKFKLNRLHGYALGQNADTRVRFQVWGALKDGNGFYDSGLLSVHLAKDQEGSWLIASQEVEEAQRIIKLVNTLFKDVTAESGLGSAPGWVRRLTEMVEGWRFEQSAYFLNRGLGVADVDGDDDLDVLFAGTERASLWLNDGTGHFTEASEKWGLGRQETNLSLFPLFGDVDNDGDSDLLLLGLLGNSRIFRNDGSKFSDVTEASGLTIGEYAMTASFGDYDDDGYLDLFIGSYGNTKEAVPANVIYGRNAPPSKLFHNQGNWTFKDTTERSGIDNTGWALASGFFDANSDNKLDLYVANDFGYDCLYFNNGDGTFTDGTWSSGAHDMGNTMSVSFIDYDADGDLDIYTSNIESNTQWFQGPGVNFILARFFTNPSTCGQTFATFRDLGTHLSWGELENLGYRATSGNTLMENLGEGKFRDVSEKTKTHWAEWAWGAAPGDFDCDGDTDVFVGNGFITGPDTKDL